jgi:hypothetical protein
VRVTKTRSASLCLKSRWLLGGITTDSNSVERLSQPPNRKHVLAGVSKNAAGGSECSRIGRVKKNLHRRRKLAQIPDTKGLNSSVLGRPGFNDPGYNKPACGQRGALSLPLFKCAVAFIEISR